jgi:hypothetical protein
MIYVFKTSVKTKRDVRVLKPRLNELLKPEKWNFDLHDCDKILRVDSQTDLSHRIINEFKDSGFYCEELK